MPRKRVISLLLVAFSMLAIGVAVAQAAATKGKHHAAKANHGQDAEHSSSTTTPIKHLVVLFDENVSFDHYFGTYPRAANTDGNPFHPAGDTPTVNGLSKWLRTHNPNLGNPQRLRYDEAATCDQGHGYTAEQNAFDHGLMDQFVQDTGNSLTLQQCLAKEGNPATDSRPSNYAVMDYYDGNTVTGLWNYAQRFAMSDNSWSDTFGPSTPGAFNVTSGNTYGAICGPTTAVYGGTPCTDAPGTVAASPGSPQPSGTETVYSDADPNFDKCSVTQDRKTPAQTIQMGGQNIGDLLGQAGVTWGWFQGGFEYAGYQPGHWTAAGAAQDCMETHSPVQAPSNSSHDYNPHHEPFQYYRSTANPQHLPPTSISMIGRQDQANHQYDMRDFWAAADSGNMPAVSYLKPPDYQDGHAQYSDPIDEQHFIVNTINQLERLRDWKNTAVVIAYDDSDGWYDHQMGPILTHSQTPLDTLSAPGQCGSNLNQVPKSDSGTPEEARCGVGMRQPLLVISPFSRQNFVDNHLTTQSSVVKFIEDNWLRGERIGNGSNDTVAGSLTHMLSFSSRGSNASLYLDPSTGEPASDWGSKSRRH